MAWWTPKPSKHDAAALRAMGGSIALGSLVQWVALADPPPTLAHPLFMRICASIQVAAGLWIVLGPRAIASRKASGGRNGEQRDEP